MCMRNRLNLFPFFFSALYGAFALYLLLHRSPYAPQNSVQNHHKIAGK